MKLCRHKLAAHYADRLKDTESVEDQLKTILETVTGQKLPTDRGGHFFRDVGVNSLAGLKLAHTIRHDFGISISLDLLFERNMNLQRLADLIKDPSLLNSTSTESIETRLLHDSKLFELSASIVKPENIAQSPSMIFITGATGFIGAFLLAELLNVYPTCCKFVCLVRQQSATKAMDRIRHKMIGFQIWREDFVDRIIALHGDLTKDHFDLDQETYENLAARTEMIFHCGATVNFALPYSQLYDSNIRGTREVIRLASYTSAYIPIQYISTMSVLPSGVAAETSIDDLSTVHLRSGYAQSKWVAEKLISRAGLCGVPVVIYRLGSIGARTVTGACNANDLNTLFIATIVKMGSYPTPIFDAPLNALPVDIAVQQIVSLHRMQSNSSGAIYGVVNDTSNILFQHILDAMINCDIDIQPIPYDVWRAKLALGSRQNNLPEWSAEFFIYRPFKPKIGILVENESDGTSSVSVPSMPVDYIRTWLLFILHHIIRG